MEEEASFQRAQFAPPAVQGSIPPNEDEPAARMNVAPVPASSDASRARRLGVGQRKSTKRSKISQQQLNALEEVSTAPAAREARARERAEQGLMRGWARLAERIWVRLDGAARV